MGGSLRISTALLAGALCLGGCGTTTPSLHEFYDSEESATMVEHVMEHVDCEVRDAVQFFVLDARDAPVFASWPKNQGKPFAWLSKWDAQVTLVITVDEKSALTPSVAITPPLPSRTVHFGDGTSTTTAQSLSLGAGLTASVDATRKGTISWLISLGDMLNDKALEDARKRRDDLYASARRSGTSTVPSPCHDRDGHFVGGDLAFRDWLYTTLLPTTVHDGIIGNAQRALELEASASKKDVIQDDITFVVLYGGSVNPVFKLLRIAGGQASPPLFGAQRTRTQDVLITLGPEAPNGALNQAAQNQALASLIGIAVANAIRNNQ